MLAGISHHALPVLPGHIHLLHQIGFRDHFVNINELGSVSALDRLLRYCSIGSVNYGLTRFPHPQVFPPLALWANNAPRIEGP